MPTFKDMVKQLGGVPVATEDLFLAGGKWYFCDPTNGTAGGSGRTPSTACSSLETTYGYLRDAKNDGIIFLGGATGNTLAAALTWSKSYTHLIGVSSPLPGMGQRCRVIAAAASDLATCITVSGSGCVFRNIQFYNAGDTDSEAAAAIVSGSRNAFINCFFAGMVHATSGAHAGGYSLKVSGSENYFLDCTVGIDTVAHDAANWECEISGVRNTFKDCLFLAQSTTSGKFLVKIDNTAGDLRWQRFIGCDFVYYCPNLATGPTNVFDMPAAGTSTAYVFLKHCSAFGGGAAGIGAAWADVDTSIFTQDPVANAAGGKSAAVN